MKSSLLTIRSVGAEFANRLFYPVVLAGSGIAILSIALIVWLTSLSQWWWLLGIPFIMAVSVGIGVFAIVKLVIKSVTPAQSTTQKKATKDFVDKLQRVSDAAQTPKFIILFRVVRDIAAPTENGFVGELAKDTTSLQRDFKELNRLFASEKSH